MPPGAAISDTYRLSDLKLGDEVSIRYQRVGKVAVCQTIQIKSRPGGRVPPAPGEGKVPEHFGPYHEYANALQDLQEKGIPLPVKYRLPGMESKPRSE